MSAHVSDIAAIAAITPQPLRYIKFFFPPIYIILFTVPRYIGGAYYYTTAIHIRTPSLLPSIIILCVISL